MGDWPAALLRDRSCSRSASPAAFSGSSRHVSEAGLMSPHWAPYCSWYLKVEMKCYVLVRASHSRVFSVSVHDFGKSPTQSDREWQGAVGAAGCKSQLKWMLLKECLLAWKNAGLPTWASAGWLHVCQCLWKLSLYIVQASQLFPRSFNFWSVCSQVTAQAKHLNVFSASSPFISYASRLMGHAELLMGNLEMSKRNFGIEKRSSCYLKRT